MLLYHVHNYHIADLKVLFYLIIVIYLILIVKYECDISFGEVDEILRPGFHQASLEQIKVIKTEQPSNKEQSKSADEDSSENNVQITASNKMHYNKGSYGSTSTFCNKEQRGMIAERDGSTGYPEENYGNVSSTGHVGTSLSLRRGNKGYNDAVKKSSSVHERPYTTINSSMEKKSISRKDVKQSSVDDLGMNNTSDIIQQKQWCLNNIDKEGKHSFVNVSINIGPY